MIKHQPGPHPRLFGFLGFSCPLRVRGPRPASAAPAGRAPQRPAGRPPGSLPGSSHREGWAAGALAGASGTAPAARGRAGGGCAPRVWVHAAPLRTAAPGPARPGKRPGGRRRPGRATRAVSPRRRWRTGNVRDGLGFPPQPSESERGGVCARHRAGFGGGRGASPSSLAGADRLGSAARISCRETRMPRPPAGRKRGEGACAEGGSHASALRSPPGPARRGFRRRTPGSSGADGSAEAARPPC